MSRTLHPWALLIRSGTLTTISTFDWGQIRSFSESESALRGTTSQADLSSMVLFYLRQAITPGCWACGVDQHVGCLGILGVALADAR